MEVVVDSDNFQKEVLEAKSAVLVDFWAPWCGPCKAIAPAVAAIAKKYTGKIKVCKLNLDDSSDIATRYTVMSIPTLLIFKDGKIMEKKVGTMSLPDLEKFIAAYVK